MQPFSYIYPVPLILPYWDPRYPSIYTQPKSIPTHVHAYICAYEYSNKWEPCSTGIPGLALSHPTHDRPIRGVSIYVASSALPNHVGAYHIHVYTHTHMYVYEYLLGDLTYGGGDRRERERKWEIGSGDGELMTTLIDVGSSAFEACVTGSHFATTFSFTTWRGFRYGCMGMCHVGCGVFLRITTSTFVTSSIKSTQWSRPRARTAR